MRRRLVGVGLATTLLIVVSLVVPLALLVSRQASDGARVEAERDAQSAAALVALAVTLESGSDALQSLSEGFPEGVILVLPDGSLFGDRRDGQGSLVETARSEQATITSEVDGGWELALPVIGTQGVVVVDAFVTDAELSEGVAQAWALLALLGVALIAIAIWVADRLGRRMVEPMRSLAGAAHLMGEGDLEVRVDTREMSDVPEEIVEVGDAFNTLASRLNQLLLEEREAVADLSHRLRTPLTSLRLQAEQIEAPEDRREILGQVARVEAAVDELIQASRSDQRREPARCRLDQVAKERADFWAVLAHEQGRPFEVVLGAGASELGIPEDELGVVVDVLVGNVFTHTPPGTPFRVSTGVAGNRMWIEVADEGPGLPDQALVARGESGRGSTGLGLDIARRAAEKTGGSLELMASADGGAVVRVWFG